MTINKVVVNSSPLITQEVTRYKTDVAAQSLPNTPWVVQTEAIVNKFVKMKC